ncbi:hypothetical protein [Shimazuella soli]|uniref:hypothetical protein n=1 Tax=Shimazuella soli TaxID=1892854 RepID=UPI001F103B2D|nr:hypothetical protein [Shimazuella soli]
MSEDFRNAHWDFPKVDLPIFKNFHPFSNEQDFIVTIVFIILLLLLILSQQK